MEYMINELVQWITKFRISTETMVFKFLAYNKEIRQEIATHVLEETTVPLNVSLYLMLESLQNRFFESSYLASTLLHTFEDIGKLVFDKGAVRYTGSGFLVLMTYSLDVRQWLGELEKCA